MVPRVARRRRCSLGPQARPLAWRRGLPSRVLHCCLEHACQYFYRPEDPRATRPISDWREVSGMQQPLEIDDSPAEQAVARVAAVDVAKASGRRAGQHRAGCARDRADRLGSPLATQPGYSRRGSMSRSGPSRRRSTSPARCTTARAARQQPSGCRGRLPGTPLTSESASSQNSEPRQPTRRARKTDQHPRMPRRAWSY